MRVVIIIGSEAWVRQRPVQDKVQGAQLVVHRGGYGADRIAQMACEFLKVDTLVVRVRTSGPDGQRERNTRLAEWAHNLQVLGHYVGAFAFPSRDLDDTADAVRRVRSYGIGVTVFGDGENDEEVR